MMNIEIKIVGDSNLPQYATPGSAAIDLVCMEDCIIYPGEVKMIGTGLAIHIGSGAAKPYNVAGMIVPRSGLGTRGLILSNTIGLIDEDYQGEIKVSVWNRNDIIPYTLGSGPHYQDSHIKLAAGTRFAQLIFIPIIKTQFTIVDEFTLSTDRGTGGFGSTGR